VGVLVIRSDQAPAAAPISSLVRIDPAANAVTASYPVPAHLGSVTVAGGRVWVSSLRDGSLWRLEPAAGEVQHFTTTGEPRDLAALGDKLYVASDGETAFEGRVVRYDAVNGFREAGVPVLACSVATGDGVVWAAGCPFIQRLSTDSGAFRVLRSVPIPFQTPRTAENNRSPLRDMAIGEGALWVIGDSLDRRVWRVDEHSGRITATTSLPITPRSIAAGAGGIWITGAIEDVVARLDPRTGRVVKLIPVGRGASGVAVAAGSVWVANGLAGTVSRIDPASDRVVATVHVDGLPRELAVGAGSVWVTADGG
jgi:YVTN family beta-propeller protein